LHLLYSNSDSNDNDNNDDNDSDSDNDDSHNNNSNNNNNNNNDNSPHLLWETDDCSTCVFLLVCSLAEEHYDYCWTRPSLGTAGSFLILHDSIA